MSDMYVRAQQQNVNRATDGGWVALRATRDGSPIVMPWLQALVLEGRCFNAVAPVQATISTTGMTLLALASFGDDDKTLYVDIPDGTAFLPLEVRATLQVSGAAICHFYAFVSLSLNGTGGTETAVTPRNLRVDNPVATAATAAHTADTEADTTDGTEVHLFRDVTTFDVDAAVGFENNRVWNASQTPVVPIGLDASSLNINIVQATSGTGWASAIWAELAETVFT